MQTDFEKIHQLLTNSEANGKVALQLLKGQPDLQKKVEVYFASLLDIFNKNKIAAIPSIIKKIRAEKEPKKQFLPLLQDPVFSKLLRDRERLTIKNYPIEALFHLGEFLELKRLEIHDNKSLTQLPSSLGNFPALDLFRLYSNKIKEIPASFFDGLEEVKSLHLNDNKLVALPKSLENLKKLELLNLSKNELESIPDYIGLFPELKSLYISRNKLSTLPSSLQNLENLEEVDLSYNKKMTVIPDFFVEMKALKRLDLTNNGFKKLPENLDQLSQVRLLNLNNNKLTTLPESITNMKNLGGLLLYHNPISKDEQKRIEALLPNTSISFSS